MTTHSHKHPEDAEAAFYAAFEHSDEEAMMAVWADHDNIVCAHPMGELIQGRRSITASWREIFKNRRAFHILVEQLYHHTEGNLSVRTVRESFLSDKERNIGAPMIATNIYQRDTAGWRMIAHHASPAPHRQGDTHHTATSQMH